MIQIDIPMPEGCDSCPFFRGNWKELRCMAKSRHGKKLDKTMKLYDTKQPWCPIKKVDFEPQLKWKTVGELQKGKVYIVTLNGSERREVDFCMWNGKEWGWSVDNVWSRNDDVIAWTDMPEPWMG